jgi:hypothetical protein
MTDITTRLRARRVTRWVHGTGESPRAAGFADDTLCCLAADEIERLRNALSECYGDSDADFLQEIRAILEKTK